MKMTHELVKAIRAVDTALALQSPTRMAASQVAAAMSMHIDNELEQALRQWTGMRCGNLQDLIEHVGPLGLTVQRVGDRTTWAIAGEEIMSAEMVTVQKPGHVTATVIIGRKAN